MAAAIAALPQDPAGFSDGFESGTTVAWDRVVGERGRTVTRGAAVTGAFGLRVRTGRRPAYVVDELAAPTSTYRATWRMRMDGLRSEGAAVPVLRVVDASGRRLLEVCVRTVRGAGFVRLGTAGGDTPWRPLPAGAPGLELSTGAGGATLAVDGVVVGTGPPLAAPASAVRLGAVTGTDAYGPVAFDDAPSLRRGPRGREVGPLRRRTSQTRPDARSGRTMALGADVAHPEPGRPRPAAPELPC